MDDINKSNLESNLIFLEKVGLVAVDKKILEIGSGKGQLVKILEDRGYDIVGAEVNDSYIKFAQDRFGINLTKIKTDKLDFHDNSFDIILSFDVFEHIAESDVHLQEVKRILKPNGYYILSTPNKLTNIPFEIIKEKSLVKWKNYHCSLHTYWGLKKRFKKNGFRIEFINVPSVNDYFMNKVRKYLGNPGLILLKILSPDQLPIYFKTNFYIISESYE